MRRISLALALFGAIAAAGCGGGAKPSAAAGAKGTAGVNFVVTVNNTGPGTVSDGTNTCAAAVAPATSNTCSWTYTAGTTVNLTAMATGSNYFNGWFGDCNSTSCSLSGNADKYVLAFFSATPQAHPNFVNPGLHGPAYADFLAGNPNQLQCTQCHGAQLQGAGIVPSCSSCHDNPQAIATAASSTPGSHLDASAAAYSMHGTPGTGWSQACERCHVAKGFQNYVGFLGGVATNFTGSFDVSQIYTTDTTPAAYSYGPQVCQTCHNNASDPGLTGITTILFPSLKSVTTNDNVTGLCGTCHQARESTASTASKIAAKLSAKGLGIGSVTATTVGVASAVNTFAAAGTTTSLNTSGLTAGQYAGYTAIFAGNVTAALNGVRAVVTSNTATALNFASLPAAPQNVILPAATPATSLTAAANIATGGSATTIVNSNVTTYGASNVGAFVYFASGANAGTYAQITAASGGTLTFASLTGAVVAGDQYIITAPTADSVSLYPTASAGGTTTTLVDSNRTWTVNGWANFQLLMMTGANAGSYATIASNTATTLTLSSALPNAPAAGDFYLIVAPETSAVQDAVATGLGFNNPHYLGAAATEYGSQAAMWFQYPFTYAGQVTASSTPVAATYVGAGPHVNNYDNAKCTSCHDAHTLAVDPTSCSGCHGASQNLAARQAIQVGDLDGSGVDQGLQLEIEGLKSVLWQAIYAYANSVALPGTNICFDNVNYSYWFVASASDVGPGGNSTCTSGTGWSKFTPRLARAAFVYKFAMKDPGAWAHNPTYAAQVLYDAIQDLNAGLVAKGKPAVTFNATRVVDLTATAPLNDPGYDTPPTP